MNCQQILSDIEQEVVAAKLDGKVADYIPELAKFH